MTKPITAMIACEIGYHEAVITQAYKDSVGKWTWSVGLTNATGHNVERYIDNPQSMEHCFDIYVWALNNYADQVRKVFDGYDMTEEQFGAALSFHWNTGAISTASWTKYWKQGNMKEAERRFMMWTNPPEITERRQAERDLLFKGIWANDGQMTEYDIHSNYNPDWGSGKRFDAMAIFLDLFDEKADPQVPDHEVDIETKPLLEKIIDLESRVAVLEGKC